ncbi:MAG: phage holin family protein [Desulfobulbaceae bacterium]|nr:phage holin family protein [Desulfobulbaceae bacterium]
MRWPARRLAGRTKITVAIVESVSRLAGTFIAILQTRLELIGVEVEEESLRFFSYLILALAAMFCIGMALLLGVVLTIVIYWDTQRMGVLITLMVLFALSGAAIMFGVRRNYRMRPKILSHTLKELSRDIDRLKPTQRETGV